MLQPWFIVIYKIGMNKPFTTILDWALKHSNVIYSSITNMIYFDIK